MFETRDKAHSFLAPFCQQATLAMRCYMPVHLGKQHGQAPCCFMPVHLGKHNTGTSG